MRETYQSTIGSRRGDLQRLFEKMMELECKRCRHKWNYQGKKKPIDDYAIYVSCPRCRTVVKLTAESKSAPVEDP